MKIKIAFIFLISALIIVFTYCQGSTEPGETFKDPREMTWTVDTLMPDPEAIQLMPVNLLVFNPDDVWMVCYSDVARRLLWHYNGTAWTPVESGGGKRYEDLAGYNAEDIWMGGYSGEHPHFTHKAGNTFTRFDFNARGHILDMSMDKASNIWACGMEGMVMKYDKSNWGIDTVKVPNVNSSLLTLRSILPDSDTTYISASVYEVPYRYYIIKGSFGNWRIIDSMRKSSPTNPITFGNFGITKIDNSIYTYGGGGVWKMNKGSGEQIFSVGAETYYLFGLSRNYMFALGVNEYAHFFNSQTRTKLIDILQNHGSDISYWRGWTNGVETFIVGYTNSDFPTKTVVYHGK